MIEELRRIGVNEEEIPYFSLLVENPNLSEGLNLHDYVGIAEYLASGMIGRVGVPRSIDVNLNGKRLDEKIAYDLINSLRKDFDKITERRNCKDGMSPFEILLMSEYLGRLNQGKPSGNVNVTPINPNYFLGPSILGRPGALTTGAGGIVSESGMIDYLNRLDKETKDKVLSGNEGFYRLIGDLSEKHPLSKGSIPFPRTLKLSQLEDERGFSFEDEESMRLAGVPPEYFRHYIKAYQSLGGCYDANGAVQKLLWPVAKSLGIRTYRKDLHGVKEK